MPPRTLRSASYTTLPRLIGYVRVSTEEQAREGVSLEAQRDRIAAYCQAHAYELIGVESDGGVSGKVPPEQRPGGARAFAAIRAGDANGLVVLKLDRLARSTRDILALVDETRASRWRLISVSEHLDTETAAGRLVVTVLAALSQMEREQIGERTRSALDHLARQGRARSRFTPFGWHTADGGFINRRGDRSALVRDVAEQAVLSCILALREHGAGARRIAATLNAEGCPSRSGRAWTPESVASILRRAERWSRAGATASVQPTESVAVQRGAA